jgi:6-phosphogluconate dehydrogenase (decarboxylating)
MVGLGRVGVNLAERLVRGATQINYVDFGTSGGIWGLTEGHSMNGVDMRNQFDGHEIKKE